MSFRLLNPLGSHGGAQNLTQGFGENPQMYTPVTGRPGHSGIDLGIPVGTPVRLSLIHI